jgi:GAF domain-containing protein/anti-sigma regulatory factor (Ser/Thr protein kinase)
MSEVARTEVEATRPGLSGETKVGLMVTAVALIVVAAAPVLSDLPTPQRSLVVPWWVVAALVAIAEAAVVHFRFRRDSYSFSLSEVPLVVGLYLANPISFLLGQALGNLAAFVLRRNRGVKLYFNVVQHSAQAVVAMMVFRGLAQFGNPYGPWGWLGVVIGTLAALLVADYLVTQAIRLTGGTLSRTELNDVLLFSVAASSMNAGLGLIAVMLIDSQPGAVWLGVLPPLILLVAYRAYTNQRDERARAESLYEAVLALHAAPLIEDALDVVTLGVMEMFESRVCVVLVIPEWGGRFVYQTVAMNGRVTGRMRPAVFDATVEPWASAIANPDGLIHRAEDGVELGLPGVGSLTQAMISPVRSGERLAGVIVVGNPSGSITEYDERDLQTFATMARHLATSLENGRLEDSLAEVTRLKERLEELVRSKDQFIASVSHELRTPLTGIIGLTQELRESRDLFGPEETNELLELVFEQSLELGNIIEDLLVAARADLGTLAVKPVHTVLEAELEPVLTSHVDKAGPKRLSTRIRGGASAVVDPLRFRQIMRNLVTNAIRYGGNNIWIEIDDDPEVARVAVVDDGVGVPDSAIEQIFEPYGRATETAMNPASVGLGLAVSRQLARLMGGDLVYRRDGGTTRFELILPAATERAGIAV